MKKSGLKYLIIGGVLAVLVFGGIYLYIGNDKKQNASLDNGDFMTGDVLVTESVDITSLADNNLNDGEDANGDSAASSSDYFIEGDFLLDGVVSEEERTAMDLNTKYLQKLVDEAKKDQIIKLPAGTFYFSSGGEIVRGNENYVAKLNSNVHIEGAGINEDKDGEYTILKPYADAGTIENGLDMFYWNELADSNGKNPEYIEDVSFKNFIIDGEDVRGNVYNSSGKGFMISLCRNCSWDTMIVRNTDGTGFGMDNVINGSITNSIAINCGKNATVSSPGGSGFGIGTGYSNEESMYISNCRSIGNTKYGFFFENQNRFGGDRDRFSATKSEGFVVVDSYATGNLYNFGGERANDVVYVNCSSDRDVVDTDGTIVGYTSSDIHYSDDSRRVGVINFNTNDYFNDVVDSNAYYYEAVNWALRNGYTNGIDGDTFGVSQEVSRGEAIGLLWRYAWRPGDVITKDEMNSSKAYITDIKTGFSDISGDEWFAGAIKWGKSIGITNGTSETNFSPNLSINRADFITMLYRYAGSPKVDGEIPFTDVSVDSYYYDAVKWGYSKNIIKGITGTEFKPEVSCTREQAITFLYRYQMLKENTYSIRFLLFDGEVSDNESSYISGTDTFVLNNPTKEGYTFIGWTGSNGTVPEKRVIISKDDVGDKTYIANFKKSK